jgi:hypothetical protein
LPTYITLSGVVALRFSPDTKLIAASNYLIPGVTIMRTSNGEVVNSFTVISATIPIWIIWNVVILDSTPNIIIGASSEEGLNVLKINCASRTILYNKVFGD